MPTPQNYKDIKDRIKSDEGYTEVPMYLSYTPKDNMGRALDTVVETHRTGGWGHTMKDKEFSPPTSALADLGGAAKRHWEEKFEEDFATALEGARSIIPEKDLDPRAFGILVEMVFQMGPTKVRGFKEAIKALKAQDYDRAADQLINNYDATTGKRRGRTNWYKQTEKRALRAYERMRDLGSGPPGYAGMANAGLTPHGYPVEFRGLRHPVKPQPPVRKGASLLRDPDRRMARLGRMARLV